MSELPDQHTGDIQATPLAKLLAKELDIDLGTLVIDTGGQITEHHVRQAAEARAAVARLEPTSRTRLAAELMSMVSHGVLTRMVAVPNGQAQGAAGPDLIDLVVAAAAQALRDHPALNAHLVGDELLTLDEINIRIATLSTAASSSTVIGRADGLSLGEIAAERARIRKIAEIRELRSWDMPQATFTISSLGDDWVGSYTPPLRPPPVAALGVGRIVDPLHGGSESRLNAVLSLVFDARAVGDLDAAEFLSDLSCLLPDGSSR